MPWIFLGGELALLLVTAAIWSTTLSISLVIVAILSPILGTVADVMRGKKRLLSSFIGVGVIGTGLLVLVGTGDWLLASLFFIVGRVGFAGANVFYDGFLPQITTDDTIDRVSSRSSSTLSTPRQLSAGVARRW